MDKSKTMIYRVPVYYNVCEYVPVKAVSAEQARNYVKDHIDDMKTHSGDAYYLDDTYEIEEDLETIHGYNEQSREWDKGEEYSHEFFDATQEKNEVR